MTQSASRKEPLALSADADPLDDLFDRPDDARSEHTARASSRAARRSGGGGATPFLIAAVASLVWIVAVAAFCWSRYSLPDNPGDALDIVGSRIGTGDWMLIAAAILGPLLLIWIIAWLMRRTGELKRQSQELSSAALRLTQVAQAAEAGGRPLVLPGGSEVTDETPRHLRREVERATHAISALHAQMRAIEEALSTQARNIDDVAERAEKRARSIATVLRTEREALERLSDEVGDEAAGDGRVSVAPAALGAVGTAGVAGLAAAMGSGREDAAPAVAADDRDAGDVTDFALDEARIEAAANSDAADLLTDAPTFAREGEATREAEVMNWQDVDAGPVDATDDTGVAEGITDLRARLAEAKSNARWDRPVLSDSEASDPASLATEVAAEALDPFDDMIDERIDAGTDIRVSAGMGMGAGAAAGAAIGAVSAGLDPEPDLRAGTPPDMDTGDVHTGDVDIGDVNTGDLDMASVDAGDVNANDAETDDDAAPFRMERRHAIDWAKFTRAANFPESEEDVETLDALYDVLTDPEAASLLQCAEDTLASLADIDLYMEDFTPGLAPVTAWQGHLDGTGGDAIGGVDAPVEQSRIRAKLKGDKGFEHLCAKFMDRYEAMGRRMMGDTTDRKLIVDLSNTRTGRAYLMIAEAAGRLSA